MGNDNDDAGDDLNVDVCGNEKRKRNYQNTIRLLLYGRVLYRCLPRGRSKQHGIMCIDVSFLGNTYCGKKEENDNVRDLSTNSRLLFV